MSPSPLALLPTIHDDAFLRNDSLEAKVNELSVRNKLTLGEALSGPLTDKLCKVVGCSGPGKKRVPRRKPQRATVKQFITDPNKLIPHSFQQGAKNDPQRGQKPPKSSGCAACSNGVKENKGWRAKLGTCHRNVCTKCPAGKFFNPR